MEFSPLTAISPIDGRYRNKVNEFTAYYSEYALIKYRVVIEIEYFIALCQLPLPQLEKVDSSNFEKLRNVYLDFSIDDARRVKDIEKETNHDVKAVEYFLKEKFEDLNLTKFSEFIHFGLTSQDVNNTATPYLIKDSLNNIYGPALEELIIQLEALAAEWEEIPMLAKTHGQPASPTRLGKEIIVFVDRLKEQYNQLRKVPFSAKFGGATGNFNAHHVAYPETDWEKFGIYFVENILNLKRSRITTQIEHYDNLAALFDVMRRINTIMIDLCRDIWTYISMNYFKQKIMKGEVGSSAMPHKVNPIDFENAEGNLGMANSVFGFLSEKLPLSRLQRDLTDSTVLRNVGVPVSHTLIAIKSIKKGLGKLLVNKDTIKKDLHDNWVVVAEAIQTILRREGYPKPYEVLKSLTRTNEKITQQVIAKFVDSLDIADEIKNELKRITPENYTGIKF